MATDTRTLDNLNVCNHMTDEELMHIALERSFDDRRTTSNFDRRSISTSSSSNPSTPQPPVNPPRQVQNSANPPTSLSMLLLKRYKRKLRPVESLIVHEDTDSLLDLVRQRSNSLLEPNDEGWIGLHEAAHYGHLPSLSILINAYPDMVNKRTLKNETALLLVARKGHVSCADFLLKNGADPNIPNVDRETPLFIACENSHRAVVDLLLKYGAQVNRCNTQGISPLHEACRHGGMELCEMLLKAGANLETKNIYGITPFFTAAQHGRVDILRLLAKKGADINGQAADGATPLFEACKNGHVSAVEVLLALNADVNRSLMSGLLPLHVAVQNNHQQIVTTLIPLTSRVRIRNSGTSPLHIAADKDRDDILELLIQSEFDVNAKLSEGNTRMYEDRRSTALYFSVFNGNLEAAEMLLEAGANPNLDVFNPLLIAIRRAWIDMAAMLIKYGANVNAQITTQPSLFPSAILLNKSLPMLKLLLDNGCDAQRCFECPYGQYPHPAVAPLRRPIEEMQGNSDSAPLRPVQFCEAFCTQSLCRVIGPMVSMLLDYVGHVQLCSRLREVLERCSDWEEIKLKTAPPRPLMQLCRLRIRHLLGAQRLKLLHTMPLPARLIRFLCHDVTCLLT
ncbi:ankyrin repeat and SOCS box protein 2-like [Halichoeres trimaculatus]|uniref:ankyrin repeat and SOCS box protein 2-like n=1 Tax=Halichoeres trimaculatus TaxID=147232 RepID=UPI003D9EAB38